MTTLYMRNSIPSMYLIVERGVKAHYPSVCTGE